ncbi:hydroxyethylthiazole kinase [Butyrivibrio proteoclasticus]|uniref:Hydroxyethylthiazole kinase n=1 Tax=Butyrivibrio proteoclasticus TaxID=43305 RepID=A0A1I5RQT9_9FIRM|nr:hydroxyethylthiazole kinase [Butyrivibrio proteoclasticus]SFP60875.1 hydroxyethylthiazole kinase [Butyrivibrio proteoclasticus]
MADLIHCITNPISMMQCANAVLAIGDKPIMAEHPLEVKEITNDASALLLNLGNISDTRMEAMKISFEAALFKELPIVLDAVGVACSELRRNFVLGLINKRAALMRDKSRKFKGFFLIKGNNSEIKALLDEHYRGLGVDADESLKKEDSIKASIKLATSLNAVVLCSGETDVITDGKETFLLLNGVPEMGSVTGTGCMLGAVCASFLAHDKSLDQVIKACAFFGIAGELAREELLKNQKDMYEGCSPIGCGSFLIKLLDELSVVNEDIIEKRIKLQNI